MTEGKWRHWNEPLQSACSAPVESIQRRLAVPIIAAVTTGVVLTVMAPPFVSKRAHLGGMRQLCTVRIGTWMALAAVLVAALTARGTFGFQKTYA